MAVYVEPAVFILCPSLPSCQCADRHILTSLERLLYRPNVQVSQEIYVFSNARATANFVELRRGEVRRIPPPRTPANKAYLPPKDVMRGPPCITRGPTWLSTNPSEVRGIRCQDAREHGAHVNPTSVYTQAQRRGGPSGRCLLAVTSRDRDPS